MRWLDVALRRLVAELKCSLYPPGGRSFAEFLSVRGDFLPLFRRVDEARGGVLLGRLSIGNGVVKAL
ncbi:MAG: hypothetical protein ACPL3C_04350 [Pyrobaculum sp.]|uniref:hypothetical protein n=1 Tax=unclassified Pyrobaculum TaxID=2643434 RepID=UPI0021D9BD12|nr:hypothetical protein [Pyrobaculum sp. 3827-6]MCU7787528.1 hypothetical protein [Pyrobaculum sp. 3827-6]